MDLLGFSLERQICSVWHDLKATMFRGAKHASLYKAFRPTQPQSLVKLIIDFVKKQNPNDPTVFTTAVDVGCGSGQLTALLAPWYGTVIGIDESQAQVDEAVKENRLKNVHYQVGIAEKMPFANGSVDLITAAQCIHWLDENRFYSEVRRILNPTGCLAVSIYGNPVLRYQTDSVISEKLTKISDDLFAFFRDQQYMDARAVKAKYRVHEFQVPFKNSVRDSSVYMEKSSTVTDFVGYITSTSFYNMYMEKNPNDETLLTKLRTDLIDAFGITKVDPDRTEIELRYYIDVILACMAE